MVKQWNGLLKKEWSLMREWIYGTVVMVIVLLGAATIVLSLFTINEINSLPIAGIAIILFIIITLFLPVAFLLNSLWKEWKRSDIWLHSTCSACKLFGAKAFFAGGLGALIMFVPALLFLIYVGVFGSPLVELTSRELTISIAILIPTFFTGSIMIMSVGLFLGVFHQLIQPFVKGFAIPITIVFFSLMSWVYQRVEELSFYKKIVSLGPIGDLSKEKFYIERDSFFIGPIEPVVYSGDILLNLLFIAVLFVMSSVLFEKKVRL